MWKFKKKFNDSSVDKKILIIVGSYKSKRVNLFDQSLILLRRYLAKEKTKEVFSRQMQILRSDHLLNMERKGYPVYVWNQIQSVITAS
jgi:hypothetical protein